MYTKEELELRERLAEQEHSRWADWQKYLHSLCTRDDNDNLIIPSASVIHWERQIATDYKDLTEKEKESDRHQVDRYWHLIDQHTQEAVERARAEGIEMVRDATIDDTQDNASWHREPFECLHKLLDNTLATLTQTKGVKDE